MAQVGNSQLLGFLHMHNIAAAHTAELLASGFTECYDLHKSLNIKLKWMFTWRSISQISCFRESYSIAHQKPDAWKVLKSTKTLKYSCSNYCESPIHYPLSAKPGSRAIFLLCSSPPLLLKNIILFFKNEMSKRTMFIMEWIISFLCLTNCKWRVDTSEIRELVCIPSF